MMAKNGCGAGLELYKDDPYAENSQSLAYGYYADGNSLEVGRASTTAVVVSSIVILIFNLILTQVLLT